MKINKDNSEVKELDISKGVSPSKLIEALKSKKAILIAKDRKIEIEGNQIRIVMEQQLELANIPDHINGVELTDIHKQMLINGKEILLGDQTVKLDEERKVLKIDRPNDKQRKMKMG